MLQNLFNYSLNNCSCAGNFEAESVVAIESFVSREVLHAALTLRRAPLEDKRQVYQALSILLHLRVAQRFPQCAVNYIKRNKDIYSLLL